MFHLLPQYLFYHGKVDDLDGLLRRGFSHRIWEREGIRFSRVIYPNFTDGVVLLCKVVDRDPDSSTSPGGTTRVTVKNPDEAVPFCVVRMRAPDLLSLRAEELSVARLAERYYNICP